MQNPLDASAGERVPPGPASAGRGMTFELIGPTNRHWHARLRGDAQPFYVGREIRDSRAGYFGLFVPPARAHGPRYRADDYAETLGHWAYLLEAIGFCETGNRFALFNSYDRARFTFGFHQFAAHTPRDNLVLLLRALAAGPEMADYFPDLRLIDGRLHRVDGTNAVTDLETEHPVGRETQLLDLMAYLNPRRREVDRQEILHAARFVHWANASPAMRRTQVEVAHAILRHKMSTRYRHWFDLDGRSDLVCLAVADILHQGRGGKAAIRVALAGPDPLHALLDIGRSRYPQRCETLAAVADRLRAAGKLGRAVYDAGLDAFRDR